MENLSKTKIWLSQMRANFLLLAVVLVAIGLMFAAKYQPFEEFNFAHALLILIGVISAHSSVNLFNEYFDYKNKIDFNTERTPFSGGSGMLTAGYTNYKSVLITAISTLIVSVIIGIYFAIVSNWIILLIAAIGAFAIIFYTNFLAKILLGELFAGLTLGTLVVIGTYIAMTASPEMTLANLVPQEVWLVSIPPGILTALLLLLNEFPDAKADKEGGRNHLVIRLGKKKAAYLYFFGLFSTFGIIILLPILEVASPWLYLALLPIPLAFKAGMSAIKHGDDTIKLIPSLGINVLVVLSTDLLLAVSVLIEII